MELRPSAHLRVHDGEPERLRPDDLLGAALRLVLGVQRLVLRAPRVRQPWRLARAEQAPLAVRLDPLSHMAYRVTITSGTSARVSKCTCTSLTVVRSYCIVASITQTSNLKIKDHFSPRRKTRFTRMHWHRRYSQAVLLDAGLLSSTIEIHAAEWSTCMNRSLIQRP